MVIQSDRNHGTFSVSDPKKKFRKKIIIEFVISIQFARYINEKEREEKEKKKSYIHIILFHHAIQ